MPSITPANDLIERQLDTQALSLETHLSKDVLGLFGAMRYGAEGHVREAVELKARSKDKRDGLAVVLETSGGFIEVVQRISDTFRQHYQTVDFIVPNYAMSAGTVLVMSGDAIHMNYFSILGPIDPQVPKPDGSGYLPALGYLEQYAQMVEKDKLGQLTTIEAAFFVQKFDPAELYQFEQAKNLSVTLLEQWLVKYKFKNWTKTKDRGLPVDDAMRKERAKEIGLKLNDTKRWHTHSRGISKEVLERDLKLEIDDFGWTGETHEKITSYHTLMNDYMGKMGRNGAIHTSGLYSPWG